MLFFVLFWHLILKDYFWYIGLNSINKFYMVI